MNFFKKLRYNFFSYNKIEAERVKEKSALNSRALTFSDHINRAIRFSIYSANGGMVVETTRYDNVKDQQKTGLYVIHSDADLGEEISKIITMERLR